MKRIAMVWGLLLVAVAAFSQNPSARYQITYDREHLVLRQGHDMNVVDMELEWPRLLNGERADSLQAELCRVAFGRYVGGVEDSRQAFVQQFGKPVEGMLDSLPDDKKFCYVRCKVQQLGFAPERFMSFRVEYDCQPEALSSQKSESRIRFITYDMTTRKVMEEGDMMDLDALVNDPYNYSALLQYLSRGARTSIQGEVEASSVLGPALSGEHSAVFEVFYNNGADSFLSDIPYEVLRGAMKRRVKKMMKVDVRPAVAVGNLDFDAEKDDSLTICKQVDVRPIYKNGNAELADYLAHHFAIPELAKVEGMRSRVVARFVVERDGSLSHLSIVSPSSPSVDRAFVESLRQMYGWKPGQKDGKTVRTEYVLSMKLVTP
uniref:TonB C-terminal domain-containing protein n=1 Tax=Prevotella sp. GTC17253 TaxID=3236793 RepID=A0AB33IRP7_9BACT